MALNIFISVGHKKGGTVRGLPCIWLPPSDQLYNKHRTAHAKNSVNLPTTCPRRDLNIGGIRYKRTRAKSSIS